jgi:uncharacterized protein (TIGR00255 family)
MTGYASIQSDTGVASGQAPDPAASLTRLGLEIRSVNSRFLDLSFRLSDELRAFEPALRELIGKQVRRGKVELRAYVVDSASSAVRPPDAVLLQSLSRTQDQVLAWLPQAAPLSVADVIKLASAQQGTSETVSLEALTAMAEQALAAFVASRAREGERLASMLRDRTEQLRTLARSAQPLVPQLVEQQRAKFVDRFTEALKAADTSGTGGTVSASGAQERALTEAAAFAIRIDVMEELTRLVAHLDEIEALLSGKNAKADKKTPAELGKRLDFIIQELHREANTLGSKSSTLELTRISVDMKVLIEQMREQVQNIE